mgnify:CR=1 FL=1
MNALTHQSLVLAVAFIIMIIVFIMNVLLPSKGSKYDKFIVIAIALVVILPLMIIKVYAMQCMIYGNCMAFTWMIAAAAMVLALTYLGMFIHTMIKKKQELDKVNYTLPTE